MEVGGPIKKDTIFFFMGYQGTLVRQTPIGNAVFVPTPDMFTGDFTTFASAACNRAASHLKAPFVSYRSDPSRFSPAALKIAARLPKASDGCGSYLTGNILHENDHEIPVRVDYQLSAKQTLFARYMWSSMISRFRII